MSSQLLALHTVICSYFEAIRLIVLRVWLSLPGLMILSAAAFGKFSTSRISDLHLPFFVNDGLLTVLRGAGNSHMRTKACYNGMIILDANGANNSGRAFPTLSNPVLQLRRNGTTVAAVLFTFKAVSTFQMHHPAARQIHRHRNHRWSMNRPVITLC